MAAHHMTAGFRRWTRRSQPNDLSRRLAAIRDHRNENLGPSEIDSLGQARLRKMVALALFLDRRSLCGSISPIAARKSALCGRRPEFEEDALDKLPIRPKIRREESEGKGQRVGRRLLSRAKY